MRIAEARDASATPGLTRDPAASTRRAGPQVDTLPGRGQGETPRRVPGLSGHELDPILAAWDEQRTAMQGIGATAVDAMAGFASELRTLSLTASSPAVSDILMRASRLLDEHASMQLSVHANRMALLQG